MVEQNIRIQAAKAAIWFDHLQVTKVVQLRHQTAGYLKN